MPAGIANYLPGIYEDAVIKFNSGIGKFENRKDKYNATKAFIDSSPYLFPQAELSAQKQSFERPVRIPVMNRTAITLIDGRACVIGGQEATPNNVTLSFTTKGFQVKVPRHMLKNNVFAATEYLAQTVYHGWHKYLGFMEAACLAYLEANKSTVLVDSQYFTTSTGVYTGTKGADFYAAYMYALGLNTLDYGAAFSDVTNGASMVTRTLMGLHGAGNDVNLASLLGGENIYATNFLTPDAGYDETHFLFTKGAVGLYTWVSPNAADGEVFVPGSDQWTVEKDPVFGFFPASVHYQKACVDATVGFGGASEPVYYDKYEYTIDTSLLKAYSSVSGESPIYKFDLAASA